MSSPILVVCPNPAVDIYAYLDEFTIGAPNRIHYEKRYPGGKGLHVGMALAELGFQVTIAGFWGGETGHWIKKTCNEYYPGIRFAGPELEAWNRSCYTFKSAGEFDDTEILGTGPAIDTAGYQSFITAIKTALSAGVQMLALSGSWPAGSPENGYAQLIELAHTHHVKTIVDCTGPQLKNALKEKPFAVHLNRKEITSFFQCDFETAKDRILESCELAAITDGSAGLHLLTRDGRFHSLAKIEKVISTIGSGDCLTAGIMAGIVGNFEPQRIADLGAACGAANCLRKDLGMLYKKDVEKLFSEL